ncbi:MAG: transposase [Deltaproteobacteria bacterium]|nr:transposase [Deltaproteobacteria bacterium]
MTQPRMILPGATYLVTRRTAQRQFLLRPSHVVNENFAYCLGYAANKYDVAIHAAVVMSNHWHAVVTDNRGHLPEFMATVDRLVANAINRMLDRSENVWSSRHYSCVQLLTTEDILEKILYVLLNPVSAGLVAKGALWPGFRTSPKACTNGPMSYRRPSVYFRTGGHMPDAVPLTVTAPPGYEEFTNQDFAKMLEDEIRGEERARVALVRMKRQKFLGRQAVLRQSPWAFPYKEEERSSINPRLACRDRKKRKVAEERIRSFLIAYGDAWRAFRARDPGVEFPYGTYWMVRRAGVQCVSPWNTG